MATSKITSTTTGKYDQIFALSQGYLNKSFLQLWDSTPKSFGLHNFVLSNLMGHMESEIGPPEIIVDVSTADKYVLFNINIISGTLRLRDIDTGEFIVGMPDDGYDLAGCRIAFKVAIAADSLDLHDAAHQDIIKQLHEDAFNYSLSRLYMDLTNADLTKFNGDGSILPKAVTDSNSNWMMFFSNWMTKAHHNKVNTLGYTLTALDVNSKPKTIDPTFLPTFNQFQTCEWREQSSKKVEQGLPAGDNNCLLYLQMTKGNDIPQDLHYQYTGNMVDAGESGTLFISRALFWDRWLLPQLTSLNYKSYLFAKRAHCSNSELDPDYEWEWKIGADAAKETKRDENDSFYAFHPSTQPLGFTWGPGATRQDDHGGQWGAELKAVLECETQNSVTFTPGTNTIHFSCHIHTYVQRWSTAGGSGSADINADWSFDLEMARITSTSETNAALVPGGLAISLRPVADVTVHVDAHGSDWGTNGAPDGAADDIRKAINGIQLKELAASVEAGLSGLGRFVLPGNGTFAMADPTFNENGDFLCHLEYLPSETGGGA